MNHYVALANGQMVPALGQGTWYIGDSEQTRGQELAAMESGIAAGMTVIDTAEMYGDGNSERLVAEGIVHAPRENLFLVSKVLPHHADREHIFISCENSLQRLGTDYLDLYLLHWRGQVPLAETVACMEELKAAGKIKNWGVSNFDISDMEELWQVERGSNCLVNQVLYHIGSRGIEYSLLPWMRQHHVALMAYCPLAQASERHGLFQHKQLKRIAEKHQVTIPEVLLAWCIRDGHTLAIPKSANKEHMLSNAAADCLILDEADFQLIDAAFPPPSKKVYLDME